MRTHRLVILALAATAVLAVPAPAGSRSSELVPGQIWARISALQVSSKSKDRSKSELTELLARLVMVERGEVLVGEALERTALMASVPKEDGVIHKDGLKWQMAAYIVSAHERNLRDRLLAQTVAEQAREIRQLRTENELRKAELAVLAEQIRLLHAPATNGKPH